MMCTCIQSFDSVASHLELAILSRKFRITEHEHEVLLNILAFSLHRSTEICKSCIFTRLMGIMLHKQVIH